MIKEWSARLLVFFLLASAVLIPVIAWRRQSQGILIHAHMAETGGWTPENLTVQAGTPLKLRLTSDDVTHGFAVGQSSQPPVDVVPGEISEVTLVFDKPGKYTFYCTRWCSLNHWRMRGTIEVSGEAPEPEPVTPPLYVQLGLDVDAPHEAGRVPLSPPSAEQGEQASGETDLSAFLNVDFYRSHSPYQAWQQLRSEKALAGRSDAQLWDMVAFLWQSHTTPEAVAEGRQLFEQNCAACHGTAGRSDGVFADQLAAAGAGGGVNMMVQRPANLADPKRMLGASPALLEGKPLRAEERQDGQGDDDHRRGDAGDHGHGAVAEGVHRPIVARPGDLTRPRASSPGPTSPPSSSQPVDPP